MSLMDGASGRRGCRVQQHPAAQQVVPAGQQVRLGELQAVRAGPVQQFQLALGLKFWVQVVHGGAQQRPQQMTDPCGQTHWPLLQTSKTSHCRPHWPQWFLFVCRLVQVLLQQPWCVVGQQVPLQSIRPVGHRQPLGVQILAPVHASPQARQFEVVPSLVGV
jgi:hypothetical protein